MNTAVKLAAHERYQHKPFFGSSHAWALEILKSIPPQAVVLDVGPGSGSMGQFLKEQGCRDLHAIETDPATRKFVSPIYSTVVATLGELGAARFDLLLLLDVLEHTNDPFGFFSALCEKLSPGGSVLISVPNVAHWSVRIPLLFGWFKYQNRGIMDRTHYQFFTRSRVRDLIASVPDLEIVEFNSSIEPVEFILPKFLTRSPLFSLLAKFRLALARILPGFFAYQHLVLLRKK